MAITPDGAFAYVVNHHSHDVSVIDTSTTKCSRIPVGLFPIAVAITPDGAFAYVVNHNSKTSRIPITSRSLIHRPTPKCCLEYL